MKKELVNSSFTELNTEESTQVRGGLLGLPTIGGSIFNTILGIVGIGFQAVTGLVNTSNAKVVNTKAHGVLDVISAIGTPIFNLFGL
ncbi:MAG: hypothetical protein LBS84_12700 [Clostridiales bacterium]|jgi:hypothetical protein|nr:hypothetical protein [Clostridiales bacterium]